jgi:hypothetical protein
MRPSSHLALAWGSLGTVLTVLLLFFACTPRDQTSTEEALPTGPYDGQYTLIFYQADVPKIGATLTINGTTLSGKGITLATKAELEFSGTVSPEGKLQLTTEQPIPFTTQELTSDGNTLQHISHNEILKGIGTLTNDGSVTGTYTLGTLQGTVLGVQQPTLSALHKYDQLYQIEFFYQGKSVNSVPVRVKQSRFSGPIHSNLLDERFQIDGRVAQNGAVLLYAIGEKGTPLVAQAHITKGDVNGTFTVIQGEGITGGEIKGAIESSTQYVFIFPKEGVPQGGGLITLIEGKLQGSLSLLSPFNILEIEGTQLSSDTFQFKTTQPALEDSLFSAQATSTDKGTLQGQVTLGKTEHDLFGIRWPYPDDPHPYDGTYQVKLIRAGQEAATTTLTVQQSLFSGSVQSLLLKETFLISGFVAQSGDVYLGNVSTTPEKSVFVRAKIEQTQKITGKYYLIGFGDLLEGTIEGHLLSQ